MNLRSTSPVLAIAAAVLGLGLALSGCAASPSTPTVASLPPSGSSDSPTSPPPADVDASDTQGVQYRLDDTAERRDQIIAAWDDCLIQNGAQWQTGPVPGAAGDPSPHAFVQPIPAEARAACVSLQPLMPLELSSATNPAFHEQSLRYVDCMAAKGLFVRLTGTDTAEWTFVDGKPVPDNAGDIDHQCMLEAFSS